MKTMEATEQMEVRIKREDEVPALVKFGRGRTVIDYLKKGDTRSHREGYDAPEQFFQPSRWWTHTWLEQRDKTQYEGVPWIDLREAVETPEGYDMCIRGPMVDVNLKPGEVDWMGEPPPLMAQAMLEHGNQFGQLLALHMVQRMSNDRKPGSLDSVDVETYCRMWKAVGAKCGRIRDGQFVEEEF